MAIETKHPLSATKPKDPNIQKYLLLLVLGIVVVLLLIVWFAQS